MKIVALVGRPNVGKSTLFNALVPKKTSHALVHDTPGVTRDRREAVARLGDWSFRLVDTAGVDVHPSDQLTSEMMDQSLRALALCDIALFLVDGRSGILPGDFLVADHVRRSGKPVVLAVNKCESDAVANAIRADVHALGMGEPVMVSAAHRHGLADLYDGFVQIHSEQGFVGEGLLDGALDIPGDASGAKETSLAAPPPVLGTDVEGALSREALWERLRAHTAQHPLRVAIVGRPNAGKSTLVNRLLGEQRVLTGAQPGVTRDAIDVPWMYEGIQLCLVDTAGMRRSSLVQDTLERMSVEDSIEAIRYAQVVVCLLEPGRAFEQQDMSILRHVIQEGRVLVVAVNKIDTAADETAHAVAETIIPDVLHELPGLAVLGISAKHGWHVDVLMETIFRLYAGWGRRLATGPLNRWLSNALDMHAPPMHKGRPLRIKYMTQIKTRPPTFHVFVNIPDGLAQDYIRYLQKSMRGFFGWEGVPLRFVTRWIKNPYEGRPRGDGGRGGARGADKRGRPRGRQRT